jgi:glucosamine kinase
LAADAALCRAGQAGREQRIVACLAMAGASELDEVGAAARQLSFFDVSVTSDARAACIGAHTGRDGGIIIAGTGSIGWAILGGRDHRVGGWGFPISDEGSGAWLGCETVRRTLWAHDGLIAWTPLLRAVFARFDGDPRAIVRWMTKARPRDFGSIAPMLVEHALQGDSVAVELMQRAGKYIDHLGARLLELRANKLSLLGGLAAHIRPWLSDRTTGALVEPAGDALSGALLLARQRAESLAAAETK